MLELRALHANVNILRLRGLKLRGRLLHLHLRRQPAGVAVGGKVQSLLIGHHGRVQQLLLGIQAPQLKVVGRQLGVNAQARGLQIRRAGLGARLGRGNIEPDAAPGVHFVGEVEG